MTELFENQVVFQFGTTSCVCKDCSCVIIVPNEESIEKTRCDICGTTLCDDCLEKHECSLDICSLCENIYWNVPLEKKRCYVCMLFVCDKCNNKHKCLNKKGRKSFTQLYNEAMR